MASAMAAASPGVHARVLCQSWTSFRNRIGPAASGSRILAMDVTGTHLSLAVSDAQRRRAAPFALVTRAPSRAVVDEVAVISRGMEQAQEVSTDQFGSAFGISGLVVGWSPRPAKEGEWNKQDAVIGEEAVLYVEKFLDEWANTGNSALNVQGLMYCSEPWVMQQALSDQIDFERAAEHAAPLQKKQFKHLKYAFKKQLVSDAEAIAAARSRISASDILQAALTQLGRSSDNAH